MVWADAAGKFPVIKAARAGCAMCVYGQTELYASGCSGPELDEWADRCRTWRDQGRDVYVYFDNDARGRAPWDAMGLQERVRGGGARAQR